jgi:hypothetical protein
MVDLNALVDHEAVRDAQKTMTQVENQPRGILPKDLNPAKVKDVTARVIKVRTVTRYWQDQITQQIKAEKWPLTPYDYAILLLTTYFDLTDSEIASQLNTNEQSVHECEVKDRRAWIAHLLLDRYCNALEVWRADLDDVLSPIYDKAVHELNTFRQYLEREDLDVHANDQTTEYIHCGVISYLIRLYIDARSDVYAFEGGEFLPVARLAKVTRYSEYHLRELIRTGLVIGTQTEAGWYGLGESAVGYQHRRQGTVGIPPLARKQSTER